MKKKLFFCAVNNLQIFWKNELSIKAFNSIDLIKNQVWSYFNFKLSVWRRKINQGWDSKSSTVVYYDQLSGAHSTRKLSKTLKMNKKGRTMFENGQNKVFWSRWGVINECPQNITVDNLVNIYFFNVDDVKCQGKFLLKTLTAICDR